jgi:heme-degrading monooxygenase HmoA
MPYLRIWRYRVAPGREAEFVTAYGPAGDWARLFARGEGYLGTELLRDAARPLAYATIDRWRSEADWNGFLATHRDAYAALDRQLAPLCAEDVEVGNYTSP